ncbi:hypothetical protein KSS87_012661 [Heliosperma pusillum]|nr:hypothetical protein KSS87_012661 [Heliosperma pusillum]
MAGCVFWFYARIEQIGRSKLRLNCILFKTDKIFKMMLNLNIDCCLETTMVKQEEKISRK